jgi:hypothetical protein
VADLVLVRRLVVFPTREDLEHSHRLHEFAAEIRGKFLNSTAWIETLLNDILAGYFCPDDKRQGLFFSEVVNDMRLNSKTPCSIRYSSVNFLTFSRCER